MFTLKQILDTYKSYGLSDAEIIELYFTKNGIEDQAVALLNSLSQRQIKFFHEKVSFFKEDLEYCRAILCNSSLTECDRMELFNLAVRFTFYRDLDEDDLAKAKEIFDTGNVVFCPIYFVAYLNEKGVIQKETHDYEQDMLKGVVKRRDE